MQKQITYIQTNLLVRIWWVFFFTLLNQFLIILSQKIFINICALKTHYDQKQQILIKLYIFIASLFSIVYHLGIQKEFSIFWSKVLIFKLEFVFLTYYNAGINLFSYKFNYIQTNASTK